MNASTTIPFKGANYPVKLIIDFGNGNVLDYEQVFFEFCYSIEDVRSKVYHSMVNEEPMFFGSQIVSLRNVLHVTIQEVGAESEFEDATNITGGAFEVVEELPNEPA